MAEDKKNGKAIRFWLGGTIILLAWIFLGGSPTSSSNEPAGPTKPELVHTEGNGLQHWKLYPGGEPLRFNRLGAGPIGWYTESTDYVVRYIKMDGRPWVSKYSNAHGWIPAKVDAELKPGYARSVLGEILRIEIGLPETKVVQQGSQLVSMANAPITFMVTKRPIFDPSCSM